MPEPVIYIRGFSLPPSDSSAADSAVLADLKALSTLSHDETNTLRKRLSEVKGFLDEKAV